MTIAPGSTVGILGGGQLGRMLGTAAAQLGYRAHVFDPGMGPAADVAHKWTRGSFDDAEAVRAFADAVDVVTFEFENVPAAAIAAAAEVAPVYPDARALAVAQDRLEEKRFAKAQGVATARWAPVATAEALDFALGLVGAPAILKTRRFGYDGKGQARILDLESGAVAWDAIGGQPAVLEGMVEFAAEFSIIAVRGQDGGFATWDAPENRHRDGILATSTVPAGDAVAGHVEQATAMARSMMDALGYVGVAAFELFATDAGPVFNEMAPRVHNSGHWTIEGAVTSQFENHIRAICGLPLGSTALTGSRVEMRNLIGDEAGEWAALLADPDAHLHLYGKAEARPGRKMGHVTRVNK